MSVQRQPPYALLAGLTAISLISLLQVLFLGELTGPARSVIAAMMAGVAYMVAFYLWRAHRTRNGVTAPQAVASSSAEPPPSWAGRMINVALFLGVVGALQVAPVVGSLGAIAIARSVGGTPNDQTGRRPRRAVIAEALGWSGLVIFVISVIVYLLR